MAISIYGGIGLFRLNVLIRFDASECGFDTATAAARANREIPCNIVAGYDHDHILVPEDQAARVLSILTEAQWRERSGA